MGVGQVIGSTNLRSFRFVIKEGQEDKVKRDEFVTVNESVTGDRILGVVKDIITSNELLPDEFGRDLRLAEIILKEGEYPVPIVKVLGIEGRDGLELPRHGIKPGAIVELAEDELLRKILYQDKSYSALMGTLATRDTVNVEVNINELVSRHCAVLAMTGAGKSYTVGVLIEELMKKRGSILVFDLHGEFTKLELKGAETKVFDVEGKDRIKVNVDSLSSGDYASLMPDLTNTQRDLLDEVLNLSDKFYDHYDLNTILEILSIIYDTKKGDKPDETIFHGREITTITKKVTLPTIGALMRRIRRLDRMGIFSLKGTPLPEIVKPNRLSVFNLSEAEERVSEIIVAALTRSIFDARKKHMRDPEKGLPTPTFIIVEEAHNFAPRVVEGSYVPSRSILRKIAREGRKFGVGICIVSQRPNKLDADVLSQCNTQFIMKMVNPSDQEYIRASVETVTEDIVRDLPSLSRGEAIIAGSAINLPVPVKIRERETHVGGQDIDIVGAWNAD
ncbi:helicase HerA domain-containing protein [Candidatus Altiarchaeota archaeon]